MITPQNPMLHFTHVLSNIGMSVFLTAFAFHMPGFSPEATFSPLVVAIWIFTAVTIVSICIRLLVAYQHRKGNQHCISYFDRLNMQLIVTGAILTILAIIALGWGVVGAWLMTPYSSIARALIFACGASLAVSALIWSNVRQLFRKINDNRPKTVSISLSAFAMAAVIAVAVATSVANSALDTTAILSLIPWFASYYIYTRVDLRDRKSSH